MFFAFVAMVAGRFLCQFLFLPVPSISPLLEPQAPLPCLTRGQDPNRNTKSNAEAIPSWAQGLRDVSTEGRLQREHQQDTMRLDISARDTLETDSGNRRCMQCAPLSLTSKNGRELKKSAPRRFTNNFVI